MSRSHPSVVVEGLNTKSAKIRALAQAGYSRVEIANYLGVIYQHVRNVLVQSGIEAGSRNDLSRASGKPAKCEAELWSVTRMLEAGFELVGTCELIDGGFRYSDRAPTEAGVYAFAVDGWVMYIGLTRGALRTRLGHYVYGHVKQATSARVKDLILGALAEDKSVQVCIARPPQLEWNGLPIDGATGLETGLLRLVRPPWNQQGTS